MAVEMLSCPTLRVECSACSGQGKYKKGKKKSEGEIFGLCFKVLPGVILLTWCIQSAAGNKFPTSADCPEIMLQ